MTDEPAPSGGGAGEEPVAPGGADDSAAADAAAAGRTSNAEPAADPTPICDLCGTPMYERHCRIVCPGCGYQRDCSDP